MIAVINRDGSDVYPALLGFVLKNLLLNVGRDSVPNLYRFVVP